MAYAVVRLQDLNISYIYKLGKLIRDLLQNQFIPAAHNGNSGKTLVRCYTSGGDAVPYHCTKQNAGDC